MSPAKKEHHRVKHTLIYGSAFAMSAFLLGAGDEYVTGGENVALTFNTVEAGFDYLPSRGDHNASTSASAPEGTPGDAGIGIEQGTTDATAAPQPVESAATLTPAGSAEMPCQPGQKIGDITTDANQVALTIDDGPSTSTTRDILAQFEETDTVGTFFFLGSRLETPDGQAIAHETLAQGNEIGVHSYSHYLANPDSNATEHTQANWVFQEVLGVTPYAYRAPAFSYSPALEQAVTEAGQCFISVSTGGDTNDWMSDFEAPDVAAENIRARDDEVLANLRPGSIILAHDQVTDLPVDGGKDRPRETAAEHVRYLIDGIEARGFELVTVETLLEGATG